MSYLEKAKTLYQMVGQGQVMPAFEKYYADNVVMEEPRGKREGKAACRAYEEQFVNDVSEFHDLQIKNIAADEDNGVVFLEVAMDVSFKGGNRMLMEQTTVQKWQGDQIVHERFYYNQ